MYTKTSALTLLFAYLALAQKSQDRSESLSSVESSAAAAATHRLAQIESFQAALTTNSKLAAALSTDPIFASSPTNSALETSLESAEFSWLVTLAVDPTANAPLPTAVVKASDAALSELFLADKTYAAGLKGASGVAQSTGAAKSSGSVTAKSSGSSSSSSSGSGSSVSVKSTNSPSPTSGTSTTGSTSATSTSSKASGNGASQPTGVMKVAGVAVAGVLGAAAFF